MTIDGFRNDLAAALSTAAVAVSPDYPECAAKRVTKPFAVLGLKSVKTRPLCFGEGLSGLNARMRRADFVFSLNVYAPDSDSCLAALNDVTVAALTLSDTAVRAEGVIPERHGDCFRVCADVTISTVMALEENSEAEIIDLDISGRLTI